MQDHHNLTRVPFESWCEACLATRLKEDGHKEQVVLAFDFAYTFANKNCESVPGERLKPEDFPRTVWGNVGGHNLRYQSGAGTTRACKKRFSKPKECLVRFSLRNSQQEDLILQADGKRSCRQILKAVQQTRARLNLKTEIRAAGKEQHQSPMVL